MVFNFIGIPLFFMLIASVIGLLIGIVKKNRKMFNISRLFLLVIVILYIVGAIIFHQ